MRARPEPRARATNPRRRRKSPAPPFLNQSVGAQCDDRVGAGDAGKAFAVVANEIKNLARQASDATDQINKENSDVQTVSGEVIDALKAIQDSVVHVKDFVSGTASAVEEQSAVTRNLSANMQSAASAVNGIAADIVSINDAIKLANDAMPTTRQAATSLAR